MKLITQNGQLDLPEDFSLTIKKTNPILSEEGDASVPATLPASSRNLAALGHRERADRATRFTNKVDAILQVGPVQKRGQLVMDTIHRREGIDASFAIDSSDLYVKAKDKSLKTIFGDADKKIVWGSVASAMTDIQNVYDGQDDTQDYTVFPLLVSPYETESDGVTTRHYQYNNEDNGSGTLVYAARTVMEGDIVMSVPTGYSIAPMLKLHRMIDTLFECLGYSVTSNCFSSGALAKLVLVNNCADAIVTGTLHYKDMVPSCTLSEFLEWLLNKFHVQPVVNSETKKVKVVLMETVLAARPDEDWSGKVEGDWKVALQPKKRIILMPKGQGDDEDGAAADQKDSDDTSLEAMTKPAARTLNGLLKKYGSYVEMDELEFASLQTDSPALSDCIALRKATGMFYKLTRNTSTLETSAEEMGTNYFVYDRYNSDEKEQFQQEDVLPMMIVDPVKKNGVAPYIGERLHFHTSYQGEEDTDQVIIVAQWRRDTTNFTFKTTGTTQAFIPYKEPVNGATGLALDFSLTNYSMYATFWRRYNELLLNQSPHLSGRVKLSAGELLNADMSRKKLADGQPLLPVSAEAALGGKMGLTELEAILVKDYADGIADTAIEPSASNGLRWQISDNGEEVARVLYDTEIAEASTTYVNYSIEYNDESIYMGVPVTEGEVIVSTVQATVSVTYKEREIDHGQMIYNTYTESFENQEITLTFTAVAV